MQSVSDSVGMVARFLLKILTFDRKDLREVFFRFLVSLIASSVFVMRVGPEEVVNRALDVGKITTEQVGALEAEFYPILDELFVSKHGGA